METDVEAVVAEEGTVVAVAEITMGVVVAGEVDNPAPVIGHAQLAKIIVSLVVIHATDAALQSLAVVAAVDTIGVIAAEVHAETEIETSTEEVVEAEAVIEIGMIEMIEEVVVEIMIVVAVAVVTVEIETDIERK